MSLSLPKCDFCENLFDTCGYKCKAFPEGILLESIDDDVDVECNAQIKYKGLGLEFELEEGSIIKKIMDVRKGLL